ncbi:MAG: hypothetical protein IKT80_03500 [Bacteroidaceae bacterium]|nr:hypothetical protein [Bacteroidaceae bacterium]
MKKFMLTCATLLLAIVAQAQFFGFPQTERRIKLYSEPIVGLNDLFVGDEGFVTFELINDSHLTYDGPIYLRIFERGVSHQVLACPKIKMKPGRIYRITATFPTDRLAPFVRYAISFEYIEDHQIVPIASFEGKRPENFILRAAIINRPPAKSPYKPRVIDIPKDKYRPMSRDIEDAVRRRDNRYDYHYRAIPPRSDNKPQPAPNNNRPTERNNSDTNRSGSRL